MFLTPADRVCDLEAQGIWAGESVDAMLRRAVAAGGDAETLIDPVNRADLDGRAPERLSWNALDARVDVLAAALLAHGCVKDDIIVSQLPNTVDAVLLFLACARLGLILSPVVMQYRAHELAHVIARTAPRAFVTLAAFGGFDHAAQAATLGVPVLLFDDLRGGDPATVAPYTAANPTVGGEVLTICWTSGTEARPKGVPRDHNHWTLNGDLVAQATGMLPGDTLLNPFPLVNIGSIGGLVMPWLALPAKALVLHHPFDLGIFLKQIAGEGVSYTIAPPAVLTALLKQPALLASVDIGSLRAIGSGSAPLSPWLIGGWKEQHGIDIANIFGSNEGASLVSSALDVPDTADRARFFPRFGAEGQDWGGIIGRSLRTRLVGDDGAVVTEPGIPGEMRIAGATTFSGYWRSPDLNETAFDADGWFRTGDLFEIAGEGDLARFYRFVGRSKEIIVRGGVNISPAELDDLLTGMPQVREAATVGIPDDDLGERIAVAVVPHDGATPTLDHVRAWLRGQGVAIFKSPERLVCIDRLPRNAMNKVVRADLRAVVLLALDRASAP